MPGRNPCRVVLLVLVVGLGCQNASVRARDSAGGGNAGAGGAGSGNSGSGNSGNGNGGPGLTLPDASLDTAPTAPTNETKCAEEAHQAERAPVDLLLLVDTSGSMTDSAGMRSKWSMVKDALVAFLKDQRSAGLGVGLQFFPLLPPEKSCTMEAECPAGSPLFSRCYQWRVCAKEGDPVAGAPECEEGSLDDCQELPGTTCLPVGRCSMSGKPCLGVGTACPGLAGDMCATRGNICRYNSSMSCMQPYDQPTVPIGNLPQQEAALVTAIEARVPRGGTPMGPSVEGALAHLKAHVAAHPERRAALVLVTDGLPDGFCNRNYIEPISAALATQRAGMPPMSAYVIGVFSPKEVGVATTALGRLATAGGTEMPYLISANDDLAKRFQDALDKIRGTVLPCEFKIPMPNNGIIDYGKVNVRSGNDDVPYVKTAAGCDPVRGGWHYDRDPATGPPQSVQLCPATCAKVKADATGKVELRFGCKTVVIN